jgi:hypothetical protein
LCPRFVQDSEFWSSYSKGFIENLDMSMDDGLKKSASKVASQKFCGIEEIAAFCRLLTRDGDYYTGQTCKIIDGR